MKQKNNKGFTLVELIVVISIFTILLGILGPSVSSIFSYRAKRAANSIVAALDKTKTEAMNRLVGEMVLERTDDGYYVSYYLDRGKQSGVVEEQAEKIAPKNTLISYTTTANTAGTEILLGEKLIFTFNREDGSFRPLQKDIIRSDEITDSLNHHRDISFPDKMIADNVGNYCTSITVKGGSRTSTIKLETGTGSCTVTVS